MKKIILTCATVLALMASGHLAYAQSDKTMVRDAQMTMKYKEYTTAIELYEKLLQKSPDNLEYNYQLGICYLNMPAKKGSKDKAMNLLNKVYAQNPNYTPDLEFYLGQAYHYKYNFDEAKTHYQKAKGNYERLKGEIDANSKIKGKEKEAKKKEADDKAKLCEKRVQECTDAKDIENQPINASVENLGSSINTEFPEYTPILPKDSSFMIFTSRRDATKGGKRDYKDDQYFEDIYMAKPSGGKWSGSESLNINSKFHDAAADISSDGKTLYLYRDTPKTKGDIYVSKYDDAKKMWSEPKKLNANINTKSRETAVCVSDDGKTLYFASDKPGGKGGLDIYKSEMQGNDWGPAKAIDEINTPYDDDAPFLSFDGKALYFSSKGYNTMGGYDVFKSTKEGDKWGKPKNMGTPINSPEDDVHLVLTEDNKKGFYVSASENGFGDKDIYQISAPKLTLTKLDKAGLKITKPTPPEVLVKDPEFQFKVNYDYDKSNLRKEAITSCDNLLKYLTENPTVRVEISGHTCDIGSKDYNQALSVQRAKAVANYIIERGIDANRLVVQGYNFEKPVIPNDNNEKNRSENRRAAYEVIKK